jgi:O-antigen/teichoic acid export membrane protein
MATQQLQISDPLSTEHLHADLKGRSVRGGFWTLLSQGAMFVLGSVSTIVLARLLTPADFGIVAMVTAVTSLGQAFADLGLSEATIQRTEITHEQVSTLFWINVAIGLGLTLVTMALAPVLVWFYREPRLFNIALVTSVTFLIGGLRVQHTALLKRQMRFLALAVRDVISYVVGVPVGIIVALRGGGYWAIVAVPLAMNVTQMMLSWAMVRWLPSLPRRGAKVRSFISFGGNVAASYFITNITRSADSVFVGWYWGANPLGLYSRAYNLLMLPVRQLNGPAGSVAVPAFSRLQGDPERFARYYLRAVNLIVWIAAPIFAFLFVAAKPVIVLVLGHKWEQAAPVFQILVISALGQLLLDSSGWLLISRGLSKRLLKLLLVVSPIMVASFALGLPFGIKGVALCGSVVLLAISPWILSFTFRGTNLNLRRLGHAIMVPVLLALITTGIAKLVLDSINPQRTIPQLLVVAMTFAATYLLSLAIPGVRREIMSFKTLLHHSESAPLPIPTEELEAVAL